MYHTEQAFESYIIQQLCRPEAGYTHLQPHSFSTELTFFPDQVLGFIHDTQAAEWAKYEKALGKKATATFLSELRKELDQQGTLNVLRHGFSTYGVKFKLCYLKPANGLNAQLATRYDKVRMGVCDQLMYQHDGGKNRLDLLLTINGLPVVTIELKNQMTGQSAREAQVQYETSRPTKDKLFSFKEGALVHFAVDTDQAFMTTQLKGENTYWLPFNRGNQGGKGNAPTPGKHRTHYLWEETWTKDGLLNIVGRFMLLTKNERTLPDGRKVMNENMLFPRYHQWHVVQQVERHARVYGSGHNYLIQHSAGSGKTNSIAWLAYHLSGLFNEENQKVFDQVFIISDRRVLDKQLQDAVYQLEHKQGTIQKIDENSQQLADAILNGTPIIITTLQKFPFVFEKLAGLPARKYAVIIDEAHSSQGGTATGRMQAALAAESLDDAAKAEAEAEEGMQDEEDIINEKVSEYMKGTGRQSNISYFAFTATPKPKTMQIFGTETEDGRHVPFHVYSMRQAIEEGFILDVLRNYISYQTFFSLGKKIEEDPEFNKRKAQKALSQFMSLHPHNLAQKVQIMVEYFMNVTVKKIGGKAKAMVVTPSRKHALRYLFEFRKYIQRMNYGHIGVLVAFSGSVEDEGIEYTEAGLNGFPEAELKEQFNTDEYRILLVAEKYQTGFDQPLLHTMFVDKALSGVKAVQTLSRLNRTCVGKEDTFVLDFVNRPEDILEGFQQYYEAAELPEAVEPRKLYELMNVLRDYRIYTQEELNDFFNFWVEQGNSHSKARHAKLNAIIDVASDRFFNLHQERPEEAELFKKNLTAFTRLYGWMWQILPFQEVEFEKLYCYGRLLLAKLPTEGLEAQLTLQNDVALEYYRLQMMREGSLELEKGKRSPLEAGSSVGTGKPKDEREQLSVLIGIINDRLGTEFTDADRYFIEQIEENLANNETLKAQALANTLVNFQLGISQQFVETMFNSISQNQEFVNKVLDDQKLLDLLRNTISERIYHSINATGHV